MALPGGGLGLLLRALRVREEGADLLEAPQRRRLAKPTELQVETMIAEGDAKAALVFEAMLYQTAKAIGAMGAVAGFDLDGIVLTGGLANSNRVIGYLTEKLSRLAPIHTYPGSDECLALAEGAARVLRGQEAPLNWPVA